MRERADSPTPPRICKQGLFRPQLTYVHVKSKIKISNIHIASIAGSMSEMFIWNLRLTRMRTSRTVLTDIGPSSVCMAASPSRRAALYQESDPLPIHFGLLQLMIDTGY